MWDILADEVGNRIHCCRGLHWGICGLGYRMYDWCPLRRNWGSSLLKGGSEWILWLWDWFCHRDRFRRGGGSWLN